MFNNDWDIVLKEELKKDYFKKLMEKIKVLYQTKTIYPEYINIFKAFKETSYANVRVVILGQDPYHGEGEANGLAFSVPNNTKTPPSLKNIIKEINEEGKVRSNNDLTDLAQQGVFLLNTVLTVEKDKPLSHKKIGWEIFTDSVIKKLNEKEKVIFVLLGKESQKKKILINKRHIIIETSHPSPLSVYRGFSGSKIFNKINDNLEQKINWIGDNNGESN